MDTNWIRDGHPFVDDIRKKLAGRGAVRRFIWSGGNTFFARIRAAEDLRRYVATLREEAKAVGSHPRIVVIAHSHGGNVILDAMAGEGFSEHLSIDKAICMATPFVQASRRDTRFALEIATLGAPFLALWHVGHQVVNRLHPSWSEVTLYWHVGACLFALVASWLVYLFAKRLAQQIDVHTNVRSELIPNLQEKVVIIRTSGDEAAAGLGVLHLLNWFVLRLWSVALRPMKALGGRLRRFATFKRMTAVVIACLGTLVAVNGVPGQDDGSNQAAAWTAAGGLAILVMLVAILSFKVFPIVAERAVEVIAYLPLPILIGLLTWGFGPELLLAAPFLKISAEPAPHGSFSITTFPAEGKFAHSDSYNHPEVAEVVVRELDRFLA